MTQAESVTHQSEILAAVAMSLNLDPAVIEPHARVLFESEPVSFEAVIAFVLSVLSPTDAEHYRQLSLADIVKHTDNPEQGWGGGAPADFAQAIGYLLLIPCLPFMEGVAGIDSVVVGTDNDTSHWADIVLIVGSSYSGTGEPAIVEWQYGDRFDNEFAVRRSSFVPGTFIACCAELLSSLGKLPSRALH